MCLYTPKYCNAKGRKARAAFPSTLLARSARRPTCRKGRKCTIFSERSEYPRKRTRSTWCFINEKAGIHGVSRKNRTFAQIPRTESERKPRNDGARTPPYCKRWKTSCYARAPSGAAAVGFPPAYGHRSARAGQIPVVPIRPKPPLSGGFESIPCLFEDGGRS